MIGVERVQWGDTQPDMLFLVDRSDAPANQDSEELHAAYRTLYGAEQSRYPVRRIQNDGPAADSVFEIRAVLDELVGGIGRVS